MYCARELQVEGRGGSGGDTELQAAGGGVRGHNKQIAGEQRQVAGGDLEFEGGGRLTDRRETFSGFMIFIR